MQRATEYLPLKEGANVGISVGADVGNGNAPTTKPEHCESPVQPVYSRG